MGSQPPPLTAARPWTAVPIRDNDEPLQDLPPQLLRLEPHPYRALGAPYGPGACPFRLRRGVVSRLLRAEATLRQHHPAWRLAIFDAWRPLAVQRFMVNHAIAEACRQRGIDPHQPSPGLAAVVAEVGRFWAPPSEDPASPPPHSTGAAVDLTLATASGQELSLGSCIDAIGPVSEPDHFLERARALPEGAERQACLQWHGRRTILLEVMAAAGFVQHPNEWWHYSWGDQLWAWRSGATAAHYGRLAAPAPGEPG